jgi:hypothetical protein
LVAGPIGAGAYQAARNLGPIADQRAANNGHAQATPGDVAGAAVPALAIGAAGAAMPAVGRGLVGKVATDALAGAGIDQAAQLGGSLGTQKGVQDDPMQSVNAGITSGASRAAMSAPGAVAKNVIKPVSDNLMARTLEQPSTPEDAQSIVRVNKAMDDTRANGVNPRGTPLTDTQIANNVKSEYVRNLNGLTAELAKAGLIASSEKSDLLALINDQALRHNNTISEGLPGTQSLFDKINDLNLPEEAKSALSNGVRDLNTVSSQSFIKNTTGPFQKLGNLAGQATSVIGGLYSMNPMEAIAGVMGHGIAGKIGGALGAGADRLLGTNTPPVVLQKINAMRALKAAGVDPESTSGLAALQNVRGAVSDVAPQVGAAGRLQAAAEANRQAQSDFGDAALTDQATLQKQSAAAAALKSQQMDALQNQAQDQQAAQQANIKASMAAQGKAQQATEKAASGTIDSYLNGDIDSPEVDPGQVGRSTASEISDYLTMRRNASARLKTAQQQAGAYDKAAGSDVDSLGQAALDKAARANAVKLAMAGSVPSDNSQVPEVAAHAAVQGALLSAQRVMNQGSDLHPDDAGKLAVGLPAGPVTVGRPSGLAGRPPEAAQAPAAPAPLPTQPAAPQTAQAPARAPWRAYVANGRAAITDDVIDQAMDSLVAQKKLSPQEAQDLANHQGGHDAGRLKAIQQEAENIAYGPRSGAPQGGNQGYAVEHSVQARTNAQVYQTAALAHAQMHPAHADGILNVALQHKTPTSKMAAAATYVNAHPDAAGLFPQWLTHHGHKG